MNINQTTYLAILDAPNYEINVFFQVRNKKTGFILKNRRVRFTKCEVATIFNNGKEIKRAVNLLYQQAVIAVLDKETYTPIQSLQNKYELNCWGEVRNVRSKLLCKPFVHCERKYYKFWVDNKTVVKSLEELALEVFGRTYRLKQ